MNKSDGQILILHRQYRVRGGEDTFLDEILVPTLKKMNVSFNLLRLPPLFSGENPIEDFFETLFMFLGLEQLRPSYRYVNNYVSKGHYKIVLFNNFVPTISLALPEHFRKQKIKTMMWLHNARISCANGLLFNGKTDCHRCLTKGSRWVFLQKCLPTNLQSFLYGVIYKNKRVTRHLLRGIEKYICNSEFTANILKTSAQNIGLEDLCFEIIRMPPTATTFNILNSSKIDIAKPFYLFMGRVSYEKGADIFVEMARHYPKLNFVLSGEGPLLEGLRKIASPNLVFTGRVDFERAWLYKNAEALIIPSRVKETSSLVIAESQPFGTPVVWPAGGGAEETVKWLNRSGCAIENFVGQSFEKTDLPNSIALNSDFESKMSSLLEG